MYAQAFGAILGLIICLYEYVYGDFVVMGNIPTSQFKHIEFDLWLYIIPTMYNIIFYEFCTEYI